MSMGRYLVEAHLREGRSVAELAATHGVHRSWIYKLLARYRAEGDAGLEARSRRPKTSPTAVSVEVEEHIIRLRKQLAEQGLDAGAATIHWHLTRRMDQVPSVSSIWRTLKRRGHINPQPHKRPRSSLIRFAAELPNECWQSDITHWHLADDTHSEIINIIDDHSRLAVASIAAASVKAVDIVTAFHHAATRWGYPAALLTDNGAVYTAAPRGGHTLLELELDRLSITHKRSRPYHPQTCGKVERFHQTVKKYLAKQPPAATIADLQTQLDRFAAYYNNNRPHRALRRRTPQEVFDTKTKAHPPTPAPTTQFRVRHDRVDTSGSVTIRYNSRLHHIGIGRPHAGTQITLLIADRDIRIINQHTAEPIRNLTLDPTRDYQPQNPP